MKHPKIYETCVVYPICEQEDEVPNFDHLYGEQTKAETEPEIDLSDIIELLSGSEEKRLEMAAQSVEGTDIHPADALECKLEYLIEELTFGSSVTKSLSLIDQIIVAINQEMVPHFLERVILKVQDRKEGYRNSREHWTYRALANLDIVEDYAKRNIFSNSPYSLESNLKTAEVVELADALIELNIFKKKYSDTHVYNAMILLFGAEASTPDSLRKTSSNNFKRIKDKLAFINKLKKTYEGAVGIKLKSEK